MNITLTSDQLHQMIKEEIKRELDGQVGILSEASKRFLGLVGGMGLAGLASLKLTVNDYELTREKERVTFQVDNILQNSSEEAIDKDMDRFMGQYEKFRWGEGEQKMLKLPQNEATILPPSFSVALAVYNDKKKDLPPAFGIPQSVPTSIEATGTPQTPKEFLNTFGMVANSGYYISPFKMFAGITLKKLPTDYLITDEGAKKMQVGTVRWQVLKSNRNYVLENGMTVEQYYNHLYFHEFLSLEDVQELMQSVDPDDVDSKEEIMDLFLVANPELVRLNQKAEELGLSNPPDSGF